MDLSTRRVIRADGPVQTLLVPPGSTLKPFSLAALLEAGKLRADEKFVCPVELSIEGRSFGCTHPPMAMPITVATAIAYSCNCFVANAARRFEPGELARHLAHAGFTPSRVPPARSLTARQLQALGESNINVTPHDLLMAYSTLARRAGEAILEGLEGAVEFGTAQLAKVPGVKVAGKTGTAPGNAAWFAGFAPSRAPKYAVVVLTAGRSGGADAAPVAAQLLREVLA